MISDLTLTTKRILLFQKVQIDLKEKEAELVSLKEAGVKVTDEVSQNDADLVKEQVR